MSFVWPYTTEIQHRSISFSNLVLAMVVIIMIILKLLAMQFISTVSFRNSNCLDMEWKSQVLLFYTQILFPCRLYFAHVILFCVYQNQNLEPG